jgi:hypothetical protein
LPWKRISKALPKVRRYADDRAPTIERIRSLCEYPDRRIKAVIYVMTSIVKVLNAKEFGS